MSGFDGAPRSALRAPRFGFVVGEMDDLEGHSRALLMPLARTGKGLRLRRVLAAAVLLVVIGYASVVAAMFGLQSELLYTPRDTGGLGSPGALAIKGSTRLAIATADGETIAGWYVAPSKSGQPVFLFLHGKGGSLERKTWRWKRIAEQGAGVLAISYRGYPGSTGTPSEGGLRLDARAAYDWLIAKGHRAEDIVIHGLSLGSGVAVALAVGVRARALILEAPYTAVVDVAAERYPWVPVRLLMRDRFASIEAIGVVNVPVLIAHGDRDTVIPYVHAERLYARARQPKVLARMVGSDHSTLTRDGLYERHIWPFLERGAAALR